MCDLYDQNLISKISEKKKKRTDKSSFKVKNSYVSWTVMQLESIKKENGIHTN